MEISVVNVVMTFDRRAADEGEELARAERACQFGGVRGLVRVRLSASTIGFLFKPARKRSKPSPAKCSAKIARTE